MNGLHSCKPGNEPVVGQVKTFTIIQYPATDTKKAWTKIKSSGADQGGTPYKIMSVKPTGFTDNYGNISFNLDIEPASGQEGQTPSATAPPQRRSGNGGGMTKDEYWTRKEESDKRREARDIEAQGRMGRAHSQEMAIRYCTMVGGLPKMTEEMSDTDRLRFMIDWFERDLVRKAASTAPAAPPPDDSDEPPF